MWQARADAILSRRPEEGRAGYPTPEALEPLLRRPWEAARISVYRHTSQDVELLRRAGFRAGDANEVVALGQRARGGRLGPLVHGTGSAPREDKRLLRELNALRAAMHRAGLSTPFERADARAKQATIDEVRYLYDVLRGVRLRRPQPWRAPAGRVALREAVRRLRRGDAGDDG